MNQKKEVGERESRSPMSLKKNFHQAVQNHSWDVGVGGTALALLFTALLGSGRFLKNLDLCFLFCKMETILTSQDCRGQIKQHISFLFMP
jgi:hypothetical protein